MTQIEQMGTDQLKGCVLICYYKKIIIFATKWF